jgi:hypothetical protein
LYSKPAGTREIISRWARETRFQIRLGGGYKTNNN